MKYHYVVKDKDGRTFSGLLEVANETDLIDELHKKGLLVISIKPQKTVSFAKAKSRKQKISIDDMVVFCRQLATLINAGIPLVQSLSILEEQIENRYFAQVIGSLRKDIEAGVSFSDTLKRYPHIFSELFINMIKAGETSGMLDDIMERLAGYFEKVSALKRKIQAGLVYPIVVLVIAIVITAVLLLKVVPTFKGIFDMLGGKLPLPTLILISVSDFLRRFFALFLVIMFMAGVLLIKYINTENGRYKFDQKKLKMPVIGILFKKVAIARFSRTLSTLIKSGVNIINALEIVGKTSGNKVIEKALEQCRKAVREGESIAQPLLGSNVFPPMVCRMISIGEKTGKLEEMLTKIADFYDDQVDNAVSGLVSMMEPLIIAFLGIVIGGIVISLFLPIFKITEIIAH